MAEFCLDCWNRIMSTKDASSKYILSRKPDLCEECGEWKPVIIRVKWRYLVAGCFCQWADRFAEDTGK